MNPGAKIDQLSLKFSHAPDNNNFHFNCRNIWSRNNPVYLLFREQWNADLLSNFTLNKFYNPNKDSLFKDHNDFAKAKFERISFAYEKVLGKILPLEQVLNYGMQMKKIILSLMKLVIRKC